MISRPRGRGGRSMSGATSRRTRSSTPRARGSVGRRHRGVALPRVDPAGAGVGPRTLVGATSRYCRPRGRGGRSLHPLVKFDKDVSTPRARGSVQRDPEAVARRPVDPAGAGVGPGLEDLRDGHERRPRGRGGRSRTSGGPPHGSASTPRARGSVCAPPCGDQPRQVDPAGAGVGLFLSRAQRVTARRPRGRGGRSGRAEGQRGDRRSTPRARGSVPGAAPTRRRDVVDPAGAGVGPAPARRGAVVTCRPRGRGGRSKSERPSDLTITSTPRARGSVRPPGHVEDPFVVDPAGAGVGLAHNYANARPRSRPRGRGGRSPPG